MSYKWVKRLIEEGQTVFVFDNKRAVQEAVTTLVSKRKAFKVEPCVDDEPGEAWRIEVLEENERGGLVGRWVDE